MKHITLHCQVRRAPSENGALGGLTSAMFENGKEKWG